MVAFGGLLMLRHHLRASEGGLPPVASGEARQAGHTLLGIALIIAGLTAWIVVARWAAGGGIGALSLAMPALGLAWLGALGLRCLRHGGAQASVPGEVGRLGSLKAGMGPRLTHDDVNDDAGQRRARNLGGSREHLEREIQAE